MIVIIGIHEDHRCTAVINELLRRRETFSLFDTQDFPYDSQLTFDINDKSYGFLKTPPHTAKTPLSEIRSVYYCVNNQFKVLEEDPPEVQNIVHTNIDSAVWSFFRNLECLFVNPIDPANMHQYKGHLLKAFRQAGIRVPNTLITNDPDVILDFYEENNRQIVCKPPYGQAFTEKVTPEHLKPDLLCKLINSPVMFQEFISGTDYRAYVLNNQVWGVEVQSTTVDLNQDELAKRVPVQLPDTVIKDCLKIARISGLVFTAIDFRKTSAGEYVYFEANSSPDFTTDEAWTGYPLTSALVDVLAAER